MISFIYFDVGGVVIQDFSGTDQWHQMLADIGILTQDQYHAFMDVWNEYRHDLALHRDVDTLIPIIASRVGIVVPDGYSLLTDMVARFQRNPSTDAVIQKAQQIGRIGLLTDMYPRMYQAIRAADLMPPVSWDQIIDSSAVGVRKPDPRIFHLAEARAGVAPEEILFIDNMKENTDAAAGLGWQTFLYDSSDMVGSRDRLLSFLG
jgi:FMN phosphatase YigB (HAD superfamily)